MAEEDLRRRFEANGDGGRYAVVQDGRSFYGIWTKCGKMSKLIKIIAWLN